jgi:hypothetical protein
MTSYITLLSKIEQFCNAHLQIKKYGGEFREQMPNFSTKDEKYPVVFVEPISDLEDLNTNQFSINVYCVDIIQKDRANLNTIVSDCQLILKDMYVYYTNDMDAQLDVVGTSTMTPINNFDLDYVAGWVMSITFEVSTYGPCEIPMEPITPTPVECLPGTIENTDQTFSATVESGGLLILEDIRIAVYDQNENLLSNKFYAAAVGQQIVVEIPPCEDVIYKITDKEGDTLYEGNIPCGGSLEQVIQNSLVSNSNGSYATSILAEGSLSLPDIFFSINNTLGTQVLSSQFPSVTNQTLIAPNGEVHIKKEDSGTIAVVSTPSGVQTNYTIQDNDITVNGGNLFTLHAQEPLDIRLQNQSGGTIAAQSVTHNGNQDHVDIVINTSSFMPVGATLQKTGQTTSYATGDDGATQRGRLTNFTTLPFNNPHGNTNRFTNKNGNQGYGGGVAIDWSTFNGSTVLAYYFGDNTFRSWSAQLTQYTNSTIDGLNGWQLFNVTEALNIMNFNYPNGFLYNYAPFNLGGSRRYHWVSTNATGSNGFATETALGSAPFTTSGKTQSLNGIWVRVCNVNGTTIS